MGPPTSVGQQPGLIARFADVGRLSLWRHRDSCLPACPSCLARPWWKVWYLFETEPIETLRKRKNVVLRNLNVSFQGVKETSTEI